NGQLSFFFNEIEEMACSEKKIDAEQKALDHEVAKNDHNLTWVDSVSVLTKLLYNQEKNKQEPAIYSFKQLRKEMVTKDFRLSNFFDSIYNASLPQNRTFKKDISLFVDLIGLLTDTIDALSYTGIIISQRHLDREKTAIVDNHLSKLSKTAKIINNKKTINTFEDIFIVQQKSIYADKDHLALLTKKVKLALLNITVDKKQILLGFSSKHLPTYNKCDHCHKLLCNETDKSSMVIACGHGYHESYFIDKNKSNLKKLINTDKESLQNQKILNEDNILE
ncbi:1552_t:CDS:2, partial [Racocetra persica]